VLKRDPFGSIVRAVSRRAWLTMAVVAVLAIGGAALALRLEPSTDIGTLVPSSSEEFQATEAANEVFGDEAVLVLVEGPLQNTILTPDLGRLRDLEGCLAGNAPSFDPTLPSVCQELAEMRPAQVVYGPATFINQSALELNQALEQRLAQNDREAAALAESARRAAAQRGASPAKQREAADAARQLAERQFQGALINQALRFGLSSPPALNNPAFVEQLVFAPVVPGAETAERLPKERFAGFFPSDDAALIQVRLRPDLSADERERAIELIEVAASSARFQPQRGARLVVTGVPVVVDELAGTVERSLVWLLVAAVLVMAGTLALVFRSRLRLLPLVLALAAAGLTYGAVSLAGGGLTMASIAALPVLIGLAVDYAIQFQSRFNEVRAVGDHPPPPEVAGPAAAAAGAPTIVAAGIATGVGFLVLLLSPVPMVRGFGLILMVGVGLALACALTAGFAALVRFSSGRERPADAPPVLPRTRARLGRAGAALAGAMRRAGGRTVSFARSRGERILPARERRPSGGSIARWPGRALALAVERPRRVLAVGLALAAIGWVLDTQTEVVSDVRELVPQDLQALEDLNALQEATGVSGQIDVTLRGDDLADPAVIAWMEQFRADILSAHGYEAGERCDQGEGAPELCPALALPDLPGASGAGEPDEVRAVLDAIPPYFQQAVISSDRQVANLAFGIRLMPLDRQQEVIEDIRERLDPPPGIDATLTGLPVLAAEGNAALSSPLRRLGLLVAGLIAVFLVLWALRRSARRAAVPLIPIALATGWAALILFVLRIPLNPMSAALGAVVIAISTEFSVLLSARYQEERDAGASPGRAIDLAYGSTGAAVLASGVTAIAGFAVLAVPLWSEIEMLRDFGLVTVVGLGVSLLGVMVALPAALIWAEQHGRFTLRDLDPRRAASALRGVRGARGRGSAKPAAAAPVQATEGRAVQGRTGAASNGGIPSGIGQSVRERARRLGRGGFGR
jgi:hydrophobe/amphiphile efflux-3 (HAE3) family protein